MIASILVCCSKLCPGDSGSIVYFVDWGDELHPWGMLVGVEEDIFGTPVYQAAVLSQVFNDISADYRSTGVGELELFTVN